MPGTIDFGVGTNGGSFIYNGMPCYEGLLIADVCDAEVMLSAQVFTPDDTKYAPGAVVSVVGPGSIEGFFCEISEFTCTNGNGLPGGLPGLPLVTSVDATATYQFTLTAQGGPWTFTGANFSSLPPTPEPSTLLLFGSGLLLLGLIVCRK